jgi:hypothetical protein
MLSFVDVLKLIVRFACFLLTLIIFVCLFCFMVVKLVCCVYQVHLNDLTAAESRAAAPAAFAAAGVYGGLVVLCAVRFSWILISSRCNQQYERV